MKFGLPDWMRRRRVAALPVRAPYAAPNRMQRNRVAFAVALFVLTLFYVLAFQIIGRFMIAQFLFPLGFLMLLIIWALPHTIAPPIETMTKIFTAYLAAMLIWPDYLALSLPGMPWITAVRLTGFPLILLFLVALSVSPGFRGALGEVMAGSKWVYRLVLAFAALLMVSLLVSTGIAITANKLVVAGISLIGAFFISAFVFAKEGRATRFVYALWAIAILLCLIGIWEQRIGRPPWGGHIPSFLAVEDEGIQRRLAGGGGARSATGVYRALSRFNSPLSFAEFLTLVTPFVLHISLTAKRLWVRPLAMATLPLLFYGVISTDSRLGAAGFMMSFVIYILAWAALKWYREPGSLFGPAVTIAYPAIFAAFIAATFFVKRLERMVWGGGAHQGSNLAREQQWDMGIPMVLGRPWGFGLGNGGEALGFRGSGGVLTVDSYYLSIMLDLGIAGFVVFLALFIVAITSAGAFGLRARTWEERLLIPIAISLVNFLVGKSVLTQQENHGLVFVLLGLAVALIWRIKGQAPLPGPGLGRTKALPAERR